ncbi:MAG: VWA domain-containing protein [Terriglobales bacterium]
MLAFGLSVNAQESSGKPPSTQTPPAAEAGGPAGDVGPYSLPKKKAEEPPSPPAPKPPKNPPELQGFSITRDVPLVNVDIMVTTSNGQFIPGLKKDNFRILEDGVPQTISNFSQSEAPITAVLLVEFAATNYPFMVDALNASYSFATMLKPQDWVAVVSYDMKPHILTDFTQDKREVFAALNTLRMPGFRETNLFDALSDTIDRLEGVQGRKYIILVSSGRDTFSKLTYDKVLKRIQGSRDISIFAVSTGRAFREWVDAHYGGSFGANMALLDYLQADNEMKTFARLTGGRAYFPRFQAEFPEIFRDVAESVRNQYTVAYHPSNTKQDGTYRKLKVEVIDPQTGKPLNILDQKGHRVKYNIIAREGYTAKHEVD